MGMDISGKNPKINVSSTEFPMLEKWEDKSWPEREKSKDWKKEQKQYWEEDQKWNDANPGIYFRNNVWWWRPLWNYCAFIDDYYHNGKLISQEIHSSGHHNDGAGLESQEAALLGVSLMSSLEDGTFDSFNKEYQRKLNELPDDDCGRCNNNNRGHHKKKDCQGCDGKGTKPSMGKCYPFAKENVERFAQFCIESGGFEIW